MKTVLPAVSASQLSGVSSIASAEKAERLNRVATERNFMLYSTKVYDLNESWSMSAKIRLRKRTETFIPSVVTSLLYALSTLFQSWIAGMEYEERIFAEDCHAGTGTQKRKGRRSGKYIY